MHTEIDIVLAGAGVVAPAGAVLEGVGATQVLRGTDDAALKAHIGRRGIRYKDRATRLALAASRVAMREAGLVDAGGYQDLDDTRAAVVVACCFGNADTVLHCAARIHEEGAASLSPMDLPNASANVVPATLAIWFGLRGANLLSAGGAASGYDALLFASNLIRAGRADRVLVCGVEARQPALAPLFAAQGAVEADDIGAALVLERADHYRRRTGRDAPCGLAMRIDGTPGMPLAVPQLGCAGEPEARPCHAPGAYPGTYGAEAILAVIAARDAMCARLDGVRA